MTKGTHLLRSALLALLALAVISGASFAGGDLFDSSYDDCPTKTRLRDGQISDLTVNRDTAEADEVDVSWAATDATGWGLGPNAFDTSLVVILDDGGDLATKTLSLGTRKVTFDDVDTGVEVKVQMAIVVDHADGNYLISDILEQSMNQSLTAPLFTTGWNRVSATADDDDDVAGFQIQTEAVAAGMMYYLGYNENFGNYKSDRLTTTPRTPRLRIGLAHSINEDDDAREDVDFDAYKIRITGEDGDVVDEGDDVATIATTSYGGDTSTTHTWDPGTGTNTTEVFDKQLVIYGLDGVITFNTAAANPTREVGTIGASEYALHNIRIVDGSETITAMHYISPLDRHASDPPQPLGADVTLIKVDRLTTSALTEAPAVTLGTVYAAPPDEHRDFPIDTLDSDETHTIEAWAVDEDGTQISPIATLKVRPKDDEYGVTNFRDYQLSDPISGSISLTTTRFTVIK